MPKRFYKLNNINMRKKILIVALCSIATNLFAFDFEANGIYYDIKSSKDFTAEVTKNDEITYEGDVVIPDEVTFNGKVLKVVAVGNGAFFNSKNLTSVSFGKNIEAIGEKAFCNCINLKEFYFPHRIKSLGSNAFYGCNTLTSLIIPKSLTQIGFSAFENCSNLSEIKFEDGLEIIGEKMFKECNSLTKVVIPPSINSIGSYAFTGCENLENLIIEDGDSELLIGGFQPWYDTNVKKLYLGRNIGHLPGYYMQIFWQMKSPLQYTIGEKVTNLFWLACKQVETIVLKGVNPPACNTFSDAQYANINVYIPEGTKDAYMQAEPWKNFWNLIESTPSGISHVSIDNDKIEAVYSSDGRKVDFYVPGINIVKMKSRKVYKIRK